MQGRYKGMKELKNQLDYRISVRMTMQERRELEKAAISTGDRTLGECVRRAVKWYIHYQHTVDVMEIQARREGKALPEYVAGIMQRVAAQEEEEHV